MKNNIYNYCLRLNMANERHARILKTLNSLNRKVYKTKSEFFLRAFDHYIDCLESGNLDIPDKSPYISEQDLEKRLEDFKKDFRLELYDEIFKRMAPVVVSQTTGRTADPGGAGSPGTGNGGDLDLTQFGDIMSDIENWSSN